MLDPTIYKDWQIAEEAEKNLPSVEYFREKLGLLPDEIIPYGKTPKLDFIKIMNRLKDKPDGKFTVHSEGTITPPDWESLDGTLYISKIGKPYMIFCHEWVQVNDGEMCAIEMSADLKRAVGEPILLFKASEASWIAEAQRNKGIYVTDGPFPYRCDDGTLLLLWSSMGEEGYTEAIAVSDNGDIDGNWVQRDELLFKKDGGHGMIFKTFDDKLLLLLHSPNKHPLERPAYFELEDKNGMLYVK